MISLTLFKHDFKSNIALIIVMSFVLCMMTMVITFATGTMSTDKSSEKVTDSTEDFYKYLTGLAVYNGATGSELSVEDFQTGDSEEIYENAFAMVSTKLDADLTTEGFEDVIDVMETSDVPLDTYIREFEYAYALADEKGCFDGEALTLDDMMETTLSVMGVSTDLIDNMTNMDMTTMLNSVYFTGIGLVPGLLLIVILSNSLLASQVDDGSMAYILSTPTKRSKVVATQCLFMIVAPLIPLTCAFAVKLRANAAFMDDHDTFKTFMLYAGMYILLEAIAGICYLASCFFNQSRKAMALGGGLAVWFFLASMLGIYGSDDMVTMGIGVEQLGIFTKTTLVGLFDIKAISTLANESPDYSFVWKLIVLGAIAVVCYLAGAIKFIKKDLPL